MDGFNFRRALDHAHSVNISSDQTYQLSLYIQSDPNIEQKTDSKVTIQCSSQVTKNIIFEQNVSSDYLRKVDSDSVTLRGAKSRKIRPTTKLVVDTDGLLNETLSGEVFARMDIFRGKVPFVKLIDATVELGEDLTAIVRINKRGIVRV